MIHGNMNDVISLDSALSIAKQNKLDLVEISPKSDPPVVKLMDYSKYKYQKSKKLSLAKKKQHKVQVKEVKFRPAIAESDFNVKLANAKKFIIAGDKVKITLQFRGREMMYVSNGFKILEQIKLELEELAKVDSFPEKVEGRHLIMILSPIKSVDKNI